MRTRLIVLSALAAAFSLGAPVLGAPSTPAPAPAAEPDYAKLIADHAAALVTIKFVLRVDFGGQQQEHEQEGTGVMIDGKGLVLCTNSAVGGIPPAMARRYGNVTFQATKLKVLIGDDTEGVDAKLIARDSDLDLAWVRIDKAPDKPFAAVSFAGAPATRIGDHLVILDRLGKMFDRVPSVSEMRVGAVIRKPRPMLSPASALYHSSAPVFSDDLKPVGFIAVFIADEEDSEAEDAARPQPMVIPAAEIVAATDRALKTAEADAAAGKAPEGEAAPEAPKDK